MLEDEQLPFSAVLAPVMPSVRLGAGASRLQLAPEWRLGAPKGRPLPPLQRVEDAIRTLAANPHRPEAEMPPITGPGVWRPPVKTAQRPTIADKAAQLLKGGDSRPTVLVPRDPILDQSLPPIHRKARGSACLEAAMGGRLIHRAPSSDRQVVQHTAVPQREPVAKEEEDLESPITLGEEGTSGMKHQGRHGRQGDLSPRSYHHRERRSSLQGVGSGATKSVQRPRAGSHPGNSPGGMFQSSLAKAH